MATGHYHCEVKIISRAAGHSCVAAAAYRARDKLCDERTGITHDYTPKKDIVHKEILAPEGAAEWVLDRGKLWNAVEKAEDISTRRAKAQLCREVIVSLPRDLSKDAQIKLIRHFVADQFVGKGMVADFSIHCPPARDGKPNPHAHILLTMRVLTPEGFGKKEREWNTALFTRDDMVKDKSKLRDLRETWQEYANKALSDAGSPIRIDHRSYAERGILAIPRPYLTKTAYHEYLRTGQETPRFVQWQKGCLAAQAENIGRTIDRTPQGHAHRARQVGGEELVKRRKKPFEVPEPGQQPHRETHFPRHYGGVLNEPDREIDR